MILNFPDRRSAKSNASADANGAKPVFAASKAKHAAFAATDEADEDNKDAYDELCDTSSPGSRSVAQCRRLRHD
jgi:hypothetical protein